MKIAGKDIEVRGRYVRVARLAADGIEFLDDPHLALDELRKTRTRIDLFTFLQRLPCTEPQFRFPMEWDNVAALPITTFDNWWTKQVDFKVRNKVRKSEKNGLTVREVAFDDALIEGISTIYNESPVRQGKRFWHYGKDLQTVKAENGTFLERSIFIGAFLDERLVGFLKLVWDEARSQANVMQILSTLRDRDKAPTNALIAQGVRSCADRHIPYFVYSNFSYGKKQRDSLADFKRSNGFQRLELPRYYVPLTLVGQAALRLGLHHRFAERVPESVMVHVRKVRSRWYASRFQIAKEAL